MRLLVIEDEPRIREQLIETLTQQGYAVDSAADGEEGQYLGRETPYDAAIVDLGLPKINGVEVIQTWRSEGLSFPIIILTARGAWQDKVEGLNAGADDYVVKPFHTEELLARLTALLRRSSGHAKSELSFGPIHLDLSAKTVACDGTPVELTSYEYNTLEYLVLNRGKAISKTELTEHLYAQDHDRDSNVIEVFVGRLRKKLDPSNSLKPIATVRGQGYRFQLEPTT